MKILTCEQMKEAEQLSVKNGMTYLGLMENAGKSCYKKIKKIISSKSKKITVCCGNGNNGGDGFVIAGLLINDGYDVEVILALGEPMTDISANVYDRLKKSGCRIIDYIFNEDEALMRIVKSDYIIDSIFGTGLSREVDEKTGRLFDAINKLNKTVVSIDVPSGLRGDIQSVEGNYIKADVTLAICTLKPCHVFSPAMNKCGEIVVVSIGIDKEYIEKCSTLSYYTKNIKEIKESFKERNPVSNKGDYGKVLAICGSQRMPGAAVLSAKGVIRAGAGLLTVAFPDKAYSAIASKLTEPLMLPLESDNEGFLDKRALYRIIEKLDEFDVILVGCGLGVTEDTSRIVCEVIRKATCPIVIDGDGINIVSQNINILRASRAPIILTPHPGEMSRLTGLDIEQIQKNRIQTVKKFAFENKVTVALKGAN
ncbi:MAG: NAD(P)H-hydrate epimerase, partial [Clostridia bacterium]|nr:NAD(P)H-hydrate epimerase [Clostridia bacterium]